MTIMEIAREYFPQTTANNMEKLNEIVMLTKRMQEEHWGNVLGDVDRGEMFRKNADPHQAFIGGFLMGVAFSRKLEEVKNEELEK